MIRESSELDAIASEIHVTGQPIALDLETYGTSEDKKIRRDETLDPWRGDIRLLSLQLPDRVPWLIDLRATGYSLGELGKALEATEVIGHNIKCDALWLARKCNVHLVKMVDTSSASRILSNGDSKLGNRLAQVADRYLGIELRKDQGRSDWGALMLLGEQIQYAVQDVEHLHALKEKLDAELKAAALVGVLRLEMALLPVVVGMELIGFCVDRKKLEELAAEATQERDQVAQTVNNLLGTGDVNLNAPAQLLKALQGLGIALKNTNEESLSECRIRLPPLSWSTGNGRSSKRMSSLASTKSGPTAEFMASLIRWEPIPGGSRVPSRICKILRAENSGPPLWHQSGMFW
jgi:Ribonuclease D